MLTLETEDGLFIDFGDDELVTIFDSSDTSYRIDKVIKMSYHIHQTEIQTETFIIVRDDMLLETCGDPMTAYHRLQVRRLCDGIRN